MLGHNNTYERNRKYSDKYQRFTICRLGLVTVSVLIGLTFATGQLVHADTTVTATELATTISGDVVENSESPPVEGERLEKVTDVSPSVTNQEDNGEGKKETLKQTTDEKEGVSPTGSAIVEEIPVMTNQIKTTDVEKSATPDKQFLQQNTTTQSRVDQEPKVQQRLMQAQVQQRTVVPRFELSDWIYNVYDQNKIIILKQYIGYGKEVTIKGHPDGKYSDYRIEIPNFSWDFWGATRALYITKISFLSAADGTKVKFTGRHLSLDGKKEGNHSFFDELSEIDFSGLDTQSVTDMSYFLAGNLSLNKINLAGLDTRRVTNMANAFMDVGRNYYEDKTIEYLDLSSFDTHNVTNMSGMFMGVKTKHLNISSFNTSKVTSMREMFSGMYTLEELDVSHFDTRNVTNMLGMFRGLHSVNKLDVSHFDTRKVTNMDYMFKGLGVAKLDISRFDTRNVISMSYMFAGMKNIDYIDLRNFNTGKVTDMANMFDNSSFKKLDVSHFDTRRVTDMSGMFTRLVNITQLDLSNFDTSSVEDMSDMFSWMENVTRIDLKSFDTHNVTSMFRMFWETQKLKILDVSHFDTHNVRGAHLMFYNCGVEELDLSHFDLKAHHGRIVGLIGGEGLRALNLSGFDLTRLREKEGVKPLDVPNLRLINLTNVRYDRDDSKFIQDFKNALNKRTGPVAIVADPELFALLKSDDSGTTIGYHWNTGEGTFIDGSKTFDLIKKQNIDPNNLYAVLPTPEELAQLPVPVKPGWTFKGWKALGPESSDIAWLKVIGYTGNFMTGNYVAEYYQTDAQKFAATLQADEVVTGFDKIPDANQGMTSVYKKDNHVRNIIWQDVTTINTSFALVGCDPIAYRAIVTFWDGTTAEIMIPVRVIDDRIEDQLTIQSPKVKVKVEEPVAKATPVTKTETLPQTGEVTETMLTTLGFSLLGMIGIGGRFTKRRKNNS